MKRKVLKPWVEETIFAIFLIGLGFLASNPGSIKAFYISKIIALVLLYPSSKMLLKYGR